MSPIYKHSILLTQLLSALLTLAALTSPTFAAVPSTMTYQGRLTDASGIPLNGDFPVRFALYTDSLFVTPYWQETQQVTCSEGLFSVVLGRTTAFPDNAFTYPPVFLGIAIGSDPEMTPRKRLHSTPFAERVGSLDGASGGWVSDQLTIENVSDGSTAVHGMGGIRGGLFQSFEISSNSVALEGQYWNFGFQVDGIGVRGESASSDGWGVGGDFMGGWYGIRSQALADSNSVYSHTGVMGSADGSGGSGDNYGLVGIAGGGYYNYGVKGYGYHNGTPGAYAYGVYGSVGYSDGYAAYAGYFDGWTTCNGTLQVLGTLYKPGGAFQIDHPLDPENKYLQHSFVESPDMKNIYDGNVVTDAKGEAVVSMPDWFSALNRDFRYQLTVIGQFAQAIVSEKMKGNHFSIKTDKPNVEVSWQVTGIRQDAYANAHRIEIEVDKKPQERGLYIDPVAFGKAPELQLHYKMNKAAEDDRKANEARSKANAEKRSTVPDLPTPTPAK